MSVVRAIRWGPVSSASASASVPELGLRSRVLTDSAARRGRGRRSADDQGRRCRDTTEECRRCFPPHAARLDAVTEAEDALAELLGGLNRTMWILTVAADGRAVGLPDGLRHPGQPGAAPVPGVRLRANHTFGVVERRSTSRSTPAPTSPTSSLARLFGEETGDEIDKFAAAPGSTAPRVSRCSRVCRVVRGPHLDRHDLGDHVGLLLGPSPSRASSRVCSRSSGPGPRRRPLSRGSTPPLEQHRDGRGARIRPRSRGERQAVVHAARPGPRVMWSFGSKVVGVIPVTRGRAFSGLAAQVTASATQAGDIGEGVGVDAAGVGAPGEAVLHAGDLGAGDGSFGFEVVGVIPVTRPSP